MPESILSVQLARVQRRWLVRSLALATAIGGASFALALIAAPLFLQASATSTRWMALAAGVIASAVVVLRTPRLSGVEAARAIERADRSLDNLLVTAAELEAQPRPVRAEIREEVMRQAEGRAGAIDVASAVSIAQPLVVAAAVVAGCALLSRGGDASLPSMMRAASEAVTGARGMGSFEVRVTPPAYAKRPVQALSNPAQISVLAGSRIDIPAIARSWIATMSEGVEIRTDPGAEPRFLSVIVTPDLAPSIRIVEPGKDTALSTPSGKVEIAIQGGDDLGLAAMTLQFTKASGGGENVSFSDGEVPLRIERRSEREWRAFAGLDLATLDLAEGDVLVYRAMARDTNPAGQPVQSDSYLIEIGKNAEIADAGFALPTEEKKYAISQQMVIYRTEQLLKSNPSNFLEESRGLAMDQRMVRAEVVFLGGGDVQDEVEEAAHSHELAEGRLENPGRAEMLRAINAMSRAEALLNDGNAKQALVFEREALVHLERALDRRRYFLRTLPDRSRIDASRRLTGERREARSWERPATATAPGSLDEQRSVMHALAGGATINASLAVRLAALDPSSALLQDAAVTLASANTDAERREAASAAMAALTKHALQSLPPSAPAGVRRAPLAGRLADEMRPR